MSLGLAVPFLLFALVAAITPGPSNLILTSTGAAVGVLRGLPALIGQVLGMGLMLFILAFGLGSLILNRTWILQGLKWCGIAFLLWLAWKIASSGHSDDKAERLRVGFWGAAAFQWVNPKAWIVCAAAVGTYFQAETGSAFGRALALALLFILVALPSCFLWLAAGASLQRLLRSQRSAKLFNVTMGALLVGSIALFVH